jgi:hypothetical protein
LRRAEAALDSIGGFGKDFHPSPTPSSVLLIQETYDCGFFFPALILFLNRDLSVLGLSPGGQLTGLLK